MSSETQTLAVPSCVEHLCKNPQVERLNFKVLFDQLLQYLKTIVKPPNSVFLQQYFAITENTITQLIYHLRNPTPVKKHVEFFDSADNFLMTEKNWQLTRENGSVLKLKRVSQDETYLRYEEITNESQIMSELKKAFKVESDAKKIEDLGLMCVVAYDLERYYIHKDTDYDFYVDVVPLEQKLDGPTYYVIGCVRVKDPAATFAEEKLESMKTVLPVRSKLHQLVAKENPTLYKRIESKGFIHSEVFATDELTHYGAHPFSPEAQNRDYQLRQDYKTWLLEKTLQERKMISAEEVPEDLFNFFLSSKAHMSDGEEEE